MGRPVTLYLVRHGESESNVALRFAGQSDSPLTERGRAQAEAVAQALADVRFDRVVTSDLSRARDTALVIAARHGLEVEPWPELREIDVGGRTGVRFAEAHDIPDWREDLFAPVPDGEHGEEVLRRLTGAVRRLAAESAGKTVCVVSHSGAIRILASYFLGVLPRLDRSPAPNTNITVVATDGTTHRVERMFDAGHVAG